MTLPRVKNPKTINQQRAEVRITLKSNPMLYQMVNNICRTGRQEKEYIIDTVRETINQQVKTNKLMHKLGQPTYPVWPEPTDKQWDIAREVSKLFKCSMEKRGLIHVEHVKTGRPVRDYTNHVLGALNVLEPTGYVDIKSTMNTALWLCVCDCGEEVTRTAHQLSRDLPWCGNRHGCEGGYKKAKEWRKRKKNVTNHPQPKPEPTAEQADEAAQHIMHNLTNSTKH
jgi:hypothetical protein